MLTLIVSQAQADSLASLELQAKQEQEQLAAIQQQLSAKTAECQV